MPTITNNGDSDVSITEFDLHLPMGVTVDVSDEVAEALADRVDFEIKQNGGKVSAPKSKEQTDDAVEGVE